MTGQFMIALAATVLLLGACGKKPTSKFLEGWTDQSIVAEKESCRSMLSGDPSATTFCACLVDKAATQVTYNEYKRPIRNTPAFTTLERLNTECGGNVAP